MSLRVGILLLCLSMANTANINCARSKLANGGIKLDCTGGSTQQIKNEYILWLDETVQGPSKQVVVVAPNFDVVNEISAAGLVKVQEGNTDVSIQLKAPKFASAAVKDIQIERASGEVTVDVQQDVPAAEKVHFSQRQSANSRPYSPLRGPIARPRERRAQENVAAPIFEVQE